MFGNNNQNNSGNGGGLFGSASKSGGGGLFGSKPSTFGGTSTFGNNNNNQGSGNMFGGSGNNNSFGGGGGMNNNSFGGGGGGFGRNDQDPTRGQQPADISNGTSMIQFENIKDKDSGTNTNAMITLKSITAEPSFASYSLEELRLNDMMLKSQGKINFNTGGGGGTAFG